MATSSSALQAYRTLLRATRVAFSTDTILLHAARTQARNGFDTLRSIDAGSSEAVKAVEHANGVAQVLRHNVVQGQRVEGSDVLSMSMGRRWGTGWCANVRDRAEHT
jgi:complex III assembly factor LYRM7